MHEEMVQVDFHMHCNMFCRGLLLSYILSAKNKSEIRHKYLFCTCESRCICLTEIYNEKILLNTYVIETDRERERERERLCRSKSILCS